MEPDQPDCNLTDITVTDDVIIGFGDGDGANAQSPPPFDGYVLAEGEDSVKNCISISFDSKLPFSPSKEREERL